MAEPTEPSLKADPFPPWPDIPDLRDRALGLLAACVEGGLLTHQSAGVRELLDLLDVESPRPSLVLQRAEGMLSETGRHAHRNKDTWADLYRAEDGEHVFWYAVVAALLFRRCVGRWPTQPVIFPDHDKRETVLTLRHHARSHLVAAGVVQDEEGVSGGPA